MSIRKHPIACICGMKSSILIKYYQLPEKFLSPQGGLIQGFFDRRKGRIICVLDFQYGVNCEGNFVVGNKTCFEAELHGLPTY